MKFHFSLPVHDLDRSLSFYRSLFQSEPAKRKVDFAKFIPDTLAINLTMHKVNADQPLPTFFHLGLQLPFEDEYQKLYNRLQSLGMITRDKAKTVCCYALQNKFWLRDPNGYQWELYYLMGDREQKSDEKRTSQGDSHAQARCC